MSGKIFLNLLYLDLYIFNIFMMNWKYLVDLKNIKKELEVSVGQSCVCNVGRSAVCVHVCVSQSALCVHVCGSVCLVCGSVCLVCGSVCLVCACVC